MAKVSVSEVLIAVSALGVASMVLATACGERSSENDPSAIGKMAQAEEACGTEVVKDITRIMFHKSGEYTAFVSQKDKEHEPQPISCEGYWHSSVYRACVVKVIEDVAEGDKSFVAIGKGGEKCAHARSLTWHVHSIAEIGGGGWSRSCGKGCTEKGQTTVLE